MNVAFDAVQLPPQDLESGGPVVAAAEVAHSSGVRKAIQSAIDRNRADRSQPLQSAYRDERANGVLFRNEQSPQTVETHREIRHGLCRP